MPDFTISSNTVVGVSLLVLLIIVFAVLVYVLYGRRNNDKAFTKAVEKLIKRKGSLKSWKVLTGLRLVDAEGNSAVCSHAVVSPYGVFIVTDIADVGEIYGKGYDQEWSGVLQTNAASAVRTKLPNYISRNRCAISVFRQVLSAEKIYNIVVEGFVVASDKSEIYISNADEDILSVREFARVLGKIKYENDNGTDITQLTELLRKFVVKK